MKTYFKLAKYGFWILLLFAPILSFGQNTSSEVLDVAVQTDVRLFNSTQQPNLNQEQLDLLSDLSGHENDLLHYYGNANPDALHGNRIEIEINGKVHVIIGDKSLPVTGEHFFWRGQSKDKSVFVDLLSNENRISGEVNFQGRAHLMYPLGKGLYAIIVQDESEKYDPKQGKDYNRVEDSPDDSDLPPRSEMSTYDCRVRLLVAWAANVNTGSRQVEDDILRAVGRMNLGLDNSNINHDVALVRTGEVETLSGSACSQADDYRTDKELNKWRDNYDADLVVVIISSGTGCVSSVNPSEANAYATVSYSNLTNVAGQTFSHELGHLYGCRHNPAADATPGSMHGYNSQEEGATTTNHWRTIMSYASGCGCSRITNFSDPNVNHPSQAIPTGTTTEHNCAGRIRSRQVTVSEFRETEEIKTLVSDTLEANEDTYAEPFGGLDLSTNGSFLIQNEAEGIFKAGRCITLNAGFHIEAGGLFETQITSCSAISLAGGGQSRTASSDENADELAEINTEPNVIEGVYWNISPNPTEGNAVIHLITDESITGSIYMVNELGQIALEVKSKITLSPGEHTIPINAGKLNAGSFFFR